MSDHRFGPQTWCILQIDHVVIAVADLDRAAARLLEKHGLGSIAGGRHEAWGTQNRMVPLGSQYLELLAADDDATHPLAQAVRATAADDGRLMGVCCETDDLEGIAGRLGTGVVDGHRITPEGTEVTWRLTGLEGALGRGLPFFIAWDSGRDAAIGRDTVVHRVEALDIARLRIGGDEAALDEWLGERVDGLQAVGGVPGLSGLTIRTSTGEQPLDY